MNISHFSRRRGRDRLSELPDALILLILSSLEMRDVVATTLLSKRWQNLWTTIPCLDFWYHSSDLHKCGSFINGALAQWKGPKILKFSINFSDHPPPANYLDSWLLFAIEKQVEELSINLRHRRNMCRRLNVYGKYCPPQCLYSCSSITKLSSYCFDLEIDANVQWDQLKSLTVVGSNYLSAHAMNQVLCGAPQLAELALCIETIYEDLTIRSTSLKTLYIGRREYGCEIVQVYAGSVLSVWAPNLTTLVIFSRCKGSCLFDVPSLTNAVLEFLECGSELDSWDFPSVEMFNQVFQSIRHVENVTLSYWCIKFLLYLKMKDVLVQFPNAKFLNLYPDEPADEMLDVLEMFPKLVILYAKCQHHFSEEERFSLASATGASLNHLKTVEISCSVTRHSIFRVIQVLLENAHMLEKMVLRFCGLGLNSNRIFNLAQEKVLKMLRSSPTAKVIIIKGRW